MALKPSGEMYLETIYVLSGKKASVRSVDVAEHMNYSKPSVSRGVVCSKKADTLLSIQMGLSPSPKTVFLSRKKSLNVTRC